MTPVPLLVHRVESASDPQFAALLRIYKEAHPRSERKPPELLERMIERPEYFFLVVTQGTAVLGFSITLCFLSSDAALLEYMAVDHDHRSQGIGRFLFQQTVAFKPVSERFVIAEVDSDKKPSADHLDRTRRKAFYRRLGCREIEGLAYIMPPVSSAAPPEMELLAYNTSLPPAIEKSQLRAWLQSCYVQVYSRPANDPRIESMLEDLPARLRLV